MNTAYRPVGETHPNPIHWKGLRGRILVELKRAPGIPAKDLASSLEVSLNAIRHHLKDLEGEALVQYERTYHGVGAPAFAYRLTPKAEALFPRRYQSTLNEVLDHVVRQEGRDAAVAMLRARYEDLTHRLQGELVSVPPAERLALVAQLLSDDGYMAEAGVSSEGGILVEHNCAIQAVAERFPEICAAEAQFLANVLGAEVDRREHILSGCSACEYRLKFGPAQSAISPSSAGNAGSGSEGLEEVL